jgi:hypothetical protein
MTDSGTLLKREEFVPQLLDLAEPPSRRRLRWFWRYLDRWRRRLFYLWQRDASAGASESLVATSVDDLISVTLLIEYLRRSERTDLPSICDIHGNCGSLAIGDFVTAVSGYLDNPTLARVLDPSDFVRTCPLPASIIRERCDRRIADAIWTVFHDRELPLTLFGDYHQMCVGFPLPKEASPLEQPPGRRPSGMFYTPASIADYLVHVTLTRLMLGQSPDRLSDLRVLDPSCGCGAFLIGSLRFLVHWCQQQPHGRGSASQEACQLMERAFCGCDIDSKALWWTARLLLLAAWQSRKDNAERLGTAPEFLTPDFGAILSCRSFLEPHGDAKFVSLEPEYDAIIGGPPFVRLESLHSTQKDQLRCYRRRFLSARRGQFDLYMLFIEQAIELLKPEGLLAFSLSNTFLRSEGGRYLRGYMAANACIEEILEIEDPRTYGDATTQIVLLRARKTMKRLDNGRNRYVLIKGQGRLREKLDHLISNRPHRDVSVIPLEAKATASSRWRLSDRDDHRWLESLHQAGVPLGQVVTAKYGPISGMDDILLLKTTGMAPGGVICAQCRREHGTSRFEAAAVRSVIRGHQLREYGHADLPNVYPFPYDNRGRLMSESEFQLMYPMTYDFLLRHRGVLSRRAIANRGSWYSTFVRLPSKTATCPRLMVSRVTSGNGFRLIVDSELLAHNSVAVLTPVNDSVDCHYLFGLLNSTVFARYVALTMPRISTGRFSLRLQQLRRFSIPLPQDGEHEDAIHRISTLVRRCLGNPVPCPSGSRLPASIDAEVRRLYDQAGEMLSSPTRGTDVAQNPC